MLAVTNGQLHYVYLYSSASSLWPGRLAVLIQVLLRASCSLYLHTNVIETLLNESGTVRFNVYTWPNVVVVVIILYL